MKYFNIKTSQGAETIDELNSKDYKTHKEFRSELKRLVNEYRIAGINTYISQRACKEWSRK